MFVAFMNFSKYVPPKNKTNRIKNKPLNISLSDTSFVKKKVLGYFTGEKGDRHHFGSKVLNI